MGLARPNLVRTPVQQLANVANPRVQGSDPRIRLLLQQQQQQSQSANIRPVVTIGAAQSSFPTHLVHRLGAPTTYDSLNQQRQQISFSQGKENI